MIQRYLGNKSIISDHIVRIARRYSSGDAMMCDIFTGTLSIALAMKKAGFRVAANDINPFSLSYARAFLVNSALPLLALDELIPTKPSLRRRNVAASTVEKARADFESVLAYLQAAKQRDVARQYRTSYFFDYYTEEGQQSSFESSRGTRGNRRFFSPANGKRIDIVLGKIREWTQRCLIDATASAVLSTVACDAIERVSNTQGTYHDFPRESYDPRALQPLSLRAPDFTELNGKRTDHIIACEDSLDFIKSVPPHQVLYIDPPYNFRQYTAYYFMPNLICQFAEMADPADYFSNVSYVRGQDMRSDFTSTFCKPREFIESLERLITKANAQTVLLSYFDGRNHWNNTNNAGNGVGIQKLASFFRSSLFERRSFRTHQFPRLNYQSYGGYQARNIEEILFVARKR